MITWICVHAADIIICMVLIAVVAAVIISTIRGRKKGKSSCGCGCSGCPMSGSCHSKQ